MRILVVEDEQKTADFIKRGLEEEGFAVDIASNGVDGQNLAEESFYDLIILDILLPGKNGLDILHELRKKQIDTPVLILTCKSAVEDKVVGLRAGADDYLAKPFYVEELLARVQTLLRRQKQVSSSILVHGDLSINILTREVTYRSKPLELSAKEYAILECLMRHPNIVLNRSSIEQKVWNQEFATESSNLIDVYIARLRHKIGEEGNKLIQTVHGTGYKLKAP
jgi:DNA-binding response OmpR family regulator